MRWLRAVVLSMGVCGIIAQAWVDPKDEASATALINQVKYEKSVQWLGQDPFLEEPARCPLPHPRLQSADAWAIVLTVDATFGLWKYFWWQYFIPGWLAGNMQSLRKYVEHVGLTGPTLNSATRSIVAEGWFARFICFSLLHEPYHGVHHENAGLPHRVLPQFTAILTPKEPGELAPFMSYRQALPDLIRSLGDPRVGAQWRDSSRNGQPVS